MKPQDIFFVGLTVALASMRRPRFFLIMGLVCVLFAIPLFATWTFFTAERLTWYASALFFLYLMTILMNRKGEKRV